MSSFFAFLDDIAVLAKTAAASIDDVAVLTKTAATSLDDITAGVSKATSKCAAVIIDDAAVTPQYVQSISPARELPVVGAISKRSLLNKAIIIIAIMILSAIAPWVFSWALLAGGCYLAFEGAEKILHSIKQRKSPTVEEIVERAPKDEQSIISGASFTDFILSVEIMLIAFDSLDFSQWYVELLALAAVGVLMTVLVYGTVGLLIKIDDLGRWIAQRGVKKSSAAQEKFGIGLVKFMPKVFSLISIIGVAAMLWVGGHLLIVNLSDLGVPVFEHFVHALTSPIGNGAILWCADTLLSAGFGLVVGSLIVGLVSGVKALFSAVRK